LLGKKKI